MKFSILIFLLAAIFPLPSLSLAVDQTLHPNANGSDVVDAVIFKIRRAAIFPDDFNLLRRLAHVETKFGQFLSPTGGGIWNVPSTVFVSTQQKIDPQLINIIQSTFDLNWPSLTYEDCLKPIVSGLAVSIAVNLNRIDDSNVVQPLQDLMGQARFLENLKLTKSYLEYFRQTWVLESKSVCTSPIDLVIVLGGSAAVTSSFTLTTQREVSFAKEIFAHFPTKSTRFGLISLNERDQVSTRIDLDNDLDYDTIRTLIGLTSAAASESEAIFVNDEILDAVTMLKNAKLRPGVPQALLIFSNRQVTPDQGNLTNLEGAREAGISTFSISIGLPEGGSEHARQLLYLAQQIPYNSFPTYDSIANDGNYMSGLNDLNYRLMPQLCALHQTLAVDGPSFLDIFVQSGDTRFFSIDVTPGVSEYFVTLTTDNGGGGEGEGAAHRLVGSLSYTEQHPSTAMYDHVIEVGENRILLEGEGSRLFIGVKVEGEVTNPVQFGVAVTTSPYVETTTTTDQSTSESETTDNGDSETTTDDGDSETTTDDGDSETTTDDGDSETTTDNGDSETTTDDGYVETTPKSTSASVTDPDNPGDDTTTTITMTTTTTTEGSGGATFILAPTVLTLFITVHVMV